MASMVSTSNSLSIVSVVLRNYIKGNYVLLGVICAAWGLQGVLKSVVGFQRSERRRKVVWKLGNVWKLSL
jgi:hypothetical protein